MRNQMSSMCAAIDIGSNTIHIVVARCTPDDLDIVADEVELVRIGESVTATGKISQQKRDDAIATLRTYKALAEQHGADPILVVATEAIRQATNSAEFLAAIKREIGLAVHIIDGNVEATLTFYGATYELNRLAHAPAQVGVMDLGGGSMELITAKNRQITWRTSVPIGSGWLHDRYLPSNPPTYDELTVAGTFLHTYFQGIRIKRYPPVLIVTGGSANSLLYLARTAFNLDPQESHLTYDDLIRCEGLLNALPAEEISQRYKQPTQRARILPAGALIIRALMARLQLSEIRVSPHGIREGVLLAYARYGAQWLQRVTENAQQKNGDAPDENSRAEMQTESYAQSGRRLLLERTHKLLEWREDVLQQDDIEAVHKMRVASRRLRAVLDAFEMVWNPTQFKKVYRRIKKIADILGKVRDTDIQIQNMQAQLEQVPSEERAGVQWLIRHLRTYRQQLQEEMEAFFKKLDEHALEKLVESCLPAERSQHGKG